MALYLSFREWAKRYDRDAFAPGILYRLPDQLLADLSTAQRGRNIRVVDDDQLLARSTVCHLGFDPINHDPVAPLGGAIFPLNLFAQCISSIINPAFYVSPHP
jgi:hypothetical protein